MRKIALLASFIFPLASLAQSAVSVSAQTCVWRAGDDPPGPCLVSS
jgi:hypothetical protein